MDNKELQKIIEESIAKAVEQAITEQKSEKEAEKKERKKSPGRPTTGLQKRERFNTTIDPDTKKKMDLVRAFHGMSVGEFLDDCIDKEYKKLVKSKKIEEIQFEVPGQLTVEDFIKQEEKAAAESKESVETEEVK